MSDSAPTLDEAMATATRQLNLEQLATKIASWGYARKITTNGSSTSQGLKLASEVGELCDAIGKKRLAKIIDGIGDVFVVLVMIAEIEKLDLTACIEAAWNEIKDRKGYLNEHGIFIKEGDTGS